jgi:rhodanese-related sulfurtransferase
MPMPTSDNPERYPFQEALEISVPETAKLHAMGKPSDEFLLLDVREPHELEIARIEGAVAIPMGDVPARINELDVDEDTTIAVLCRSGRRSLDVTLYLHQQGLLGARSVAGGILWWSDRLDPTLTKY